jgi:hypothetical protein
MRVLAVDGTRLVFTYEAFDKVVAETREIIRPGRSNPRKQRSKKPYSMNYKRL